MPDDAKQLASFLHGNASLLFKRSGVPGGGGGGCRQQQQQQLPLPPIPGLEVGGHSGGGERVNIQARPLPSPPKFTPAEEEGGERPYETTEEGWMEDYDYVHLQGKEEFEKNQKQLMEKGNIIRQSKAQLEQQQIKQFERLEHEVSQPINHDMTGWVPQHHPHQNQHPHPHPHPQHHHPPLPPANHSGPGPASSSSSGPAPTPKLCAGDRQLLLFYQEQCEHNVTTVTNAVDAFFAAVGANQPPKIFVAHGKFVILSAHKLVFIGDTLSRQAAAPEVANRVMNASNVLCDLLKTVVGATKAAALGYPSTAAVQEMVDRVTELSHRARHFKEQLLYMAAL